MFRILSAMILMVLALGCEEEEPKEGIDRSVCNWGYEYDGKCWVHVCVDDDPCPELGDDWRLMTDAEKESLLDLCYENIDPDYIISNHEDDLTRNELSLCYDCKFVMPPDDDPTGAGSCKYSPWKLNWADDRCDLFL